MFLFSQHQDGGQRFFSKQESVVFMYCECDSNQVLGKMSISIKVYDPSFFQSRLLFGSLLQEYT